MVRVGADDGDSLDEYDSDGDVGKVLHSSMWWSSPDHSVLCVSVAKPVDKSPTAVDFADITELAEEGEGEVMEGTSAGGLEDQERSEMLFQKGMAFAQAQLSGRLRRMCVCVLVPYCVVYGCSCWLSAEWEWCGCGHRM